MNWINKNNNYFLEFDNTLLISVDTNGNYYLINNKENQKWLVGTKDDSESVVKSNAEEILRQYNLVTKNLSVILLVQLIELIKSDGIPTSNVYKKLVNSKFLPPTVIPQYFIRYINPEDLIKAMGDDVEGGMKALDLYNDIISIDPTTQSVSSATITNKGRNIVVDEATDFIATANKKNILTITQGEKIFESFDECNFSVDTQLKGFTIKLDDLYSTISVVFVGSLIYVIISDELKNVDELFKYNDEIRQHILDFYGVDVNSYLNTEPINEDFGDSSEEDFNFDDNNEDKTDNQDDSFNFNDIVSEHDEEYIQELEIIQRNIEKIESLPDDIRYNDDIEEVYLLLLGKKEQIQKLSDEEKSNKIIDRVVDELSTELGDIEGLSNIKKESNSNDLNNSLTVNEGKTTNFKGKIIKPVVVNKFGVFEKQLIIGKTIHKINESADIRKILENYIADENDNSQDIIDKLLKNNETIVIKNFLSYKIVELSKNGNIITFKSWKYTSNDNVDDIMKNNKPLRNVNYDINEPKDMSNLKEDIDFYR